MINFSVHRTLFLVKADARFITGGLAIGYSVLGEAVILAWCKARIRVCHDCEYPLAGKQRVSCFLTACLNRKCDDDDGKHGYLRLMQTYVLKVRIGDLFKNANFEVVVQLHFQNLTRRCKKCVT